MMLPIPLLVSLLLGLLSLLMLAGGIFFLDRAIRRWRYYERVRKQNDQTNLNGSSENRAGARPHSLKTSWKDAAVVTPLMVGTVLLLCSFAGRHFVKLAFPVGSDEPLSMRTGTVKEVQRPDGSTIHAELYGPPDAPQLVFTHGWGTNSTEWYYAKRHLSNRFRLILWDIPGLGESKQPQDRDFALEKMASELHSVLSLANGKSVVLIGHSIGGMINLTFCRLYPDLVGSQIAGLVQVNTSYTNPVKTTKNSGLSQAIQKPVAEPLLNTMIFISPLLRIMNWLSYQNGLAYVQNAQSAFAGAETRGQLDLVSRYQFESSPAVVARGTLAMFRWDATPVLRQINAPVLILGGQQDTTTLPSASEYMKSAISNSKLDLVSPTAHYGLLEQNKHYNAAIAQFASTLTK